MQKFLLMVLMAALFSTQVCAEEIFTVNTADKPPYSTPLNTGIYDKLISRAFESLGLKIRINHLPSARSLENVNIGLDDAEYARISGLSEKYENIVIVKEQLFDFKFTAFSKDPDLEISSWHDLDSYNVAYIRGWKVFEMNVKNAKSVHLVGGDEELFSLLHNDRVDVILYDELRGKVFLEKNRIENIYPSKQPVVTRGMFLYLNKQHADLVQPLATAIRREKTEGKDL